MPNLRDLISKDEEIQELLGKLEGAFKGAARGLTTDTVGAPVDLVGGALGALGLNVGDAPVGGSQWMRKAFGQPVEDTPAELVGNLLSALTSPGKAATDIASLAPMLAGAIRPGGRYDLGLTHNLRGLLSGAGEEPLNKAAWITSPTASITNPSIAVAKHPWPFGGEGALIFNPRSELLDPRMNRNVQLFNRDAYTTRAKNPTEYGYEPSFKMGDQDVRLTEGSNPSWSQKLAILASPKFSSLEAYEKAIGGARALDKGYTPKESESIKELLKARNMRWLEQTTQKGEPIPEELLSRKPSAYGWLADIRKGAAAGDALDKKVLAKLQSLGSDYGELKVMGNIPLDQRNINALILKPDTPLHNIGPQQAHIDNIRKGMEAKGIQTGRPLDLIPELAKDDINYTRKELTKLLNNTPFSSSPNEFARFGEKTKAINSNDPLLKAIEQRFGIDPLWASVFLGNQSYEDPAQTQEAITYLLENSPSINTSLLRFLSQ